MVWGFGSLVVGVHDSKQVVVWGGTMSKYVHMYLCLLGLLVDKSGWHGGNGTVVGSFQRLL